MSALGCTRPLCSFFLLDFNIRPLLHNSNMNSNTPRKIANYVLEPFIEFDDTNASKISLEQVLVK